MIELVLLVLLVAVVALAVALVLVVRDVTHRAHLMVAQAHHENRGLISAVVAKSGVEYAQIERALASARPASPERELTREQYEAMLNDTLSGMGMDTPRVPEGL